MEGDTLYLYRSWAGNCIYRLRIDDDGENELSVNTDHEVYRYEGDEQKELDSVNSILNIWLCGELCTFHLGITFVRVTFNCIPSSLVRISSIDVSCTLFLNTFLIDSIRSFV